MDYKQERQFIKQLLVSNGINVSTFQRYKNDEYLRWADNHREMIVDGWKLRLYETTSFAIGCGEVTETECQYSQL